MSYFKVKENPSIDTFVVQAIPVVGPVLVSPLEVVISTIKILVGAVFASAAKIMNGKDKMFKAGVCLLKDGGVNLGFSLLNIGTLGIFSILELNQVTTFTKKYARVVL